MPWLCLSLRLQSKCSFRVSRRKNSQIFPCGVFFPGVFNKMFIKKCSNPTKTPLPWKIFGCAPVYREDSFKSSSFQLPRSVFSRLEISMVLMEVFVVSCKWNLFLVVLNSNGISLSLEGVPTLSNVYEKVKTFKMIKKRKLRGIADTPFGLKRFFSYIDNPDKFLA